MYGGKANISDFIQLFQRLHYICTYGGACYLLFIRAPLFFQFAEKRIYLLLRNVPLSTGYPNTSFQLGATVRLSCSVPFYDNKGAEFLALERRKTM